MEQYKKETILAYDSDPVFFSDHFLSRHQEYLKGDLQRFVSELKGPKVIDMGCGPGHDLAFFREQKLDALGIDLSESFLEMCTEKGLNIRRMDFEQPLLYNHSFDGIWAAAALLHVPRERVPRVIATWAKLLKPQGILYLAVKKGIGDEFVPNLKNADRKRYFTYFSEEELKHLLSPSFEIVEGAYSVGDVWINGLFRLKPKIIPINRNF